MKRQIAFLVSAMMTVNLFTAVPAFATDDFSDAEVIASSRIAVLARYDTMDRRFGNYHVYTKTAYLKS